MTQLAGSLLLRLAVGGFGLLALGLLRRGRRLGVEPDLALGVGVEPVDLAAVLDEGRLALGRLGELQADVGQEALDGVGAIAWWEPMGPWKTVRSFAYAAAFASA